MECSYCKKEIEKDEIYKNGKYWHKECFKKHLREKGC
ncbi:MAG: LIM domain-containing protein [Candidatus Thermoplasmatota archaeon]